MKTFIEFCDNKPSIAVKAMIDGLCRQDKRNDFEIDMNYFVRSNFTTVFGCAATCTIQELIGVDYIPEHIPLIYKSQNSFSENCNITNSMVLRNINNKMLKYDINDFEDAIDSLIGGYISDLLHYFNVNDDSVVEWLINDTKLPKLTNKNWINNLEPYEIFVSTLESFDL